ncbi:MAG: hypothetical protein JSV91_01915 [Phycisphaerales bacterium]|nr:MAG: hypothetical protein JSV91_01915 [Phycisphaerales bacterium]
MSLMYLTAGRGVRHWLALMLVLVTPVLGITVFARAQGTSGTLPDPISSRELSRYADRLDLSDEQRQAVQSIHNKYRADFARLRDGEIEEYLSTHGGAGNLRITFDRSEVEKDARDLQKLLGRIRSVDERFFDQLLALLTEQQQAMLPRIRQARERARYQSGMSLIGIIINPAARHDLSALMTELDLAPEPGSDLDLVLQQYETRLTASARDLHDVSVKKELLMFDRMAEQGYGADVLEDPSGAEGLIDVLFSAMNHVQDRMNDQAAEIADLNRRTLKELTALMPEDQARKLRGRFLQRAYHDPLVSGQRVSRRFSTALERDELTDQQRSQIEGMQLAYEQQRQQNVERLMDAHDESSRTGFLINPTEEQEALREKREKAVDDAQERCRSFDEQTMLALDAVLGEDLAQRVTRRIEQEDAESGEGQQEVRMMAVSVMSVGSGEGEAGISTFTSTFTPVDIDTGGAFTERAGIPGPLTVQDLGRHARRLEMTEDERAIASALHDDYRVQFDESTRERIEELRELEQRIGPGGGIHIREEDVEPELPTVGDVDRMYALRRELMRAVDETDSRLFDDLRAVITDDDRAQRVDRARMARRRDVYARAGDRGGGTGMFAFGGGLLTIGGSDSREESVDLTSMVEDLELPDETAARIDTILLDYEQQITDVFRTRYEASQRVDEDMQKRMVRATRQTARGREVEMSADAEGFEAIEAKREEARKAADRIVHLNRSALQQLTDTLDASTAQLLRRAYDRAAFPGVFRDPEALDGKLQAALALLDLTDGQRRDLQDLVASYTAEYEECCRRMVEFQREARVIGEDPGAGPPPIDIQDLQQRSRDLEKLKFERNELNGRTLTRLRTLLNEAQARSIGAADTGEDR